MGQIRYMPQPAGASGGTVLVIEDEVILRMDTCEHLRKKGYHVIEAGTAEEAMAVLTSREAVDVIFCDVQLPGTMGGLTFTVWAREHFPEAQIILTSGNTVVTQNVVPGKPVPFIAKPYDPEDVAAQILLIMSNPSRPASH
jgi:CheY-like chemotaxis protein